jgi:hypothetical protein
MDLTREADVQYGCKRREAIGATNARNISEDYYRD